MRITVGALQLSRFTAADRRALFRIRNHPTVRFRLPNPAPISYRSHLAWVREHLRERSDYLLFLVRWKGEAIGFSLLRRVADGTVEIGVMFQEADRWPLQICQASVLTIYWAFEVLKMDRMVSYAVSGHERALAINQAFGGRLVPSDRPGKILLEMTREEGLGNRNYQKLLARMRGRLEVEGAAAPAPWG